MGEKEITDLHPFFRVSEEETPVSGAETPVSDAEITHFVRLTRV